jgi:hypothetical protein
VDPIRVREVVKAQGVSCGSSLMNERFQVLLESRLERAKLTVDTPLHKVIQMAVMDWENGHKREIDVNNKHQHIDSLRIPGLEANSSLGFGPNCVKFKYQEMKDVFKDCLRQTARLMRDQLQAAAEAELPRSSDDEGSATFGARGYAVQKVVLIGGFSESPSLKHHLENILLNTRNLLGQPITLLKPEHVDSAVARGAVLRALNKANGPTRISRSSYGILTDELFDKNDPKHKGLKGRRSRADGRIYIRDTIQWQISVVSITSPCMAHSGQRAKGTSRTTLCLPIMKIGYEGFVSFLKRPAD